MWFRIQSEGFITTAQTGGDIPPNWGHQSSCCCVLSSVQIAPFFFNLFTFPSPPLSLVLPLSLSISFSLSLPRSLSLGSALISSRQQAPLVCISSGGAVQERPRVTVRQGGREARERERERETSHAVDASSRRRIPTSGAVFFSHEHQCVINRINLGPNFLMIAVLMYVNERSLLTHYRQFAWDTHNQTL